MAKDTKSKDTANPTATGNNGGSSPNLPATRPTGETLDEYRRLYLPARDTMVQKLNELVSTLSGDPQKLIQSLIRSANPQRKGREEMESRWMIPTVRIVQGMTKEKPDKAQPGDLFTTSGYIIPQPLKVTPIYVFGSNRMFPEGGGGGNKAPVCYAPDAKWGKPFGECAKCQNLPLGLNAAGAITDCDNGVNFVALSEDMKLYRLEFFKTSRKAGVRMDQLSAACDSIWDRWFSIKTQTQTGGGNEWHIFRISPSGEDTPAHVRQAADIIYDLVHTERKIFLKLYYDAIARGDNAAAGVSEQVDLESMGIADAGGDNPDLASGGI
jgi:hypothetical protein